ncbi:MAG: hypothetical protein IIV48_07655 [Clostridium sp.]|nr:hypothetical protein [Clostridium sp.]
MERFKKGDKVFVNITNAREQLSEVGYTDLMLAQLNPLNNYDIRFYDYTPYNYNTCRVCVNREGYAIDEWYVPIELVKRKKYRNNIHVW